MRHWEQQPTIRSPTSPYTFTYTYCLLTNSQAALEATQQNVTLQGHAQQHQQQMTSALQQVVAFLVIFLYDCVHRGPRGSYYVVVIPLYYLTY